MSLPLTLAVDVGGTGLKAAVLDAGGAMTSERMRRDTPYPCPPATLVSELVALAAQLPRFDRASVGFPGAIRRGRVIEVPSLSRASHDGPADPALAAQWAGFELAHHLQEAFGVPVRAGNDADLQGCAAVSGHGFELVLTLGTGVGTALFDEGRLLPHMELSHGPFRKGRTYDEVLGDAGRRSAGTTRWRRHVRAAIAAFDAMLLFDHCHIGGGNAKRLHPADLGPTTALVPNIAGILGGIALWQQDAVVHDPVPHAAAPAPTDRAQRVPQGSRR